MDTSTIASALVGAQAGQRQTQIAALSGPAEWASDDALKLLRAALGGTS